MTFFRYFPTKEDVILIDDYDRLIIEQLAARPAGEPIMDKIRGALKAGLERVYAADREALLARTRLILRTPALRARLWEQQASTERLIARALAAASGQEGDDLRLRVAVAASLAAVTTAVLVWAENEGADELPVLIDQALSALRNELGRADG
ncbi:hypothetical protein NET02_10805 [Thermomicrobiaceae bacterium CFH 74404]|uniref:MftR C-terminal domain-containing protein n=2 Tax=Thermalbibacter longus TaxID=2951981 RepID=A0AA42BBB1_9BACT|nr:hypothetical protein [Thermalbibacter longus]